MANKSVQLKLGNDYAYPNRANIIPFTVTPISGCNINESECWYEPDTRRVVINLYMTSSTLAGSTEWATIPQPYRPSSKKLLNCAGKDYAWWVYGCCVNIDSNGGIKISVTTSQTSIVSVWGEYYI